MRSMSEVSPTIEDARLSQGVALSNAVRTDTGLVRTNNEDAYGTRWMADGSLLVVVADGMGGHEAGEVASRLAVDTLEHVIAKRRLAGPPQAVMYEAFITANEAILQESRQGNKAGMGTTAVVAWIHGDLAHVGTVGDSRLYHVRRGEVIARTVDHTRVQVMVSKGEITEDDAKVHPEASMLTRALGHAKMSNGKPLEPEIFSEPLELEQGDVLVLSSDGLHDLVDDDEIGIIVQHSTAAGGAATLVERALNRGGHDNITVAVIHVVGGKKPRRPLRSSQVPPQRPAPTEVAEALPPTPAPDSRVVLALAFAAAVLMFLASVLGTFAVTVLSH